ncbi:MAG: DUF5104 domain-containing protein [Lachnospiraceae bacterium]|nr:DUF5104 domain-containing protein [Lachnospiraceae bacterium]
MAFVTQLLAILVIFAGVVFVAGVLITLTGIILLIIGIIRRKNAIKNGKKSSNTCIVLGCVFILIPIFAVGESVLGILALGLQEKIKRDSYENCIDEWRNEWVDSNEVREDLIEEFFAAADNNDKEALMKLYSKEIQEKPGFEEDVEEFLLEYPGDLSGLQFKYKSGHEEGSSDYGVSSDYLNAKYEVKKGEEYYYINFGCCYEHDEEPDRIGLDYMVINSEKAKVLSEELDCELDVDEHIVAYVNVTEEFEIRRIDGNPYRYIDTEEYTKEEVIEALKQSYDLNDLYCCLGEPNGISGRINYVVYEIEPDENDYRYILITHTDEGEIVKNLTQIVGTEEKTIMWLDDELEPESIGN